MQKKVSSFVISYTITVGSHYCTIFFHIRILYYFLFKYIPPPIFVIRSTRHNIIIAIFLLIRSFVLFVHFDNNLKVIAFLSTSLHSRGTLATMPLLRFELSLNHYTNIRKIVDMPKFKLLNNVRKKVCYIYLQTKI